MGIMPGVGALLILAVVAFMAVIFVFNMTR